MKEADWSSRRCAKVRQRFDDAERLLQAERSPSEPGSQRTTEALDHVARQYQPLRAHRCAPVRLAARYRLGDIAWTQAQLTFSRALHTDKRALQRAERYEASALKHFQAVLDNATKRQQTNPWVQAARQRTVRLGRAPRLVPPSPLPPEYTRVWCSDVSTLMDRFLQEHPRFDDLSRELSERVVERFLDRLDSRKNLFTVGEHRKRMTRLRTAIGEINGVQCDVLLSLAREQREALSEVMLMAKHTLAHAQPRPGNSVAIQIWRARRERPTDHGAMYDLRRRLIDFDLQRYMALGDTFEAASLKVRRELSFRYHRVQERTDTEVYQTFLEAFGNALDPHTTYLSQSRSADFDEWLSQSTVGFGFKVEERGGTPTVTYVVPGSPADSEAQLKRGDRLLAMRELPDGQTLPLPGLPIDAVWDYLTGSPGSRVAFSVQRPSQGPHPWTATAGRRTYDYKSTSLRWTTHHGPSGPLKIAIITFDSFYEGVRRDIEVKLNAARAGGADGVLLDVSDNTGGLLKEAVDIAGLFLKSGLIVSVESVDSGIRAHTDPSASEFSAPLVILTSQRTCSAAEIMTGALQDHFRALVVGDARTCGKGTYQGMIDINDRLGTLKVTRGRFFQPSGRSNLLSGIGADIVLPSVTALQRAAMPDWRYPFAVESTHGSVVHRDAWDPGRHFTAIENQASLMSSPFRARLRARSLQRQSANSHFTKLRRKLEHATDGRGVMSPADYNLYFTRLKLMKINERERIKESVRVLANLITGER